MNRGISWHRLSKIFGMGPTQFIGFILSSTNLIIIFGIGPYQFIVFNKITNRCFIFLIYMEISFLLFNTIIHYDKFYSSKVFEWKLITVRVEESLGILPLIINIKWNLLVLVKLC